MQIISWCSNLLLERHNVFIAITRKWTMTWTNRWICQYKVECQNTVGIRHKFHWFSHYEEKKVDLGEKEKKEKERSCNHLANLLCHCLLFVQLVRHKTNTSNRNILLMSSFQSILNRFRCQIWHLYTYIHTHTQQTKYTRLNRSASHGPN